MIIGNPWAEVAVELERQWRLNEWPASEAAARRNYERMKNQMRTELVNAMAGEMVPIEPSAAVAKHRLRNIIAADREAVPCGRWEKIERGAYWWVFMGSVYLRWMKDGGWIGRQAERRLKPRYRWRVRR